MSYIPSTVYGVSTAVSAYVSNSVTLYSTYGVSTAVAVSYIPIPTTATVTTTTVSISVSVSVSVSDVPTTVVATASGTGGTNGGVVTVTEGGGQYITITQVVTSYVSPSSSSSAFTCRTVAVDYLDGGYGKKKKKRSIFDIEKPIKRPQPVARPGVGLGLKGQ